MPKACDIAWMLVPRASDFRLISSLHLLAWQFSSMDVFGTPARDTGLPRRLGGHFGWKRRGPTGNVICGPINSIVPLAGWSSGFGNTTERGFRFMQNESRDESSCAPNVMPDFIEDFLERKDRKTPQKWRQIKIPPSTKRAH
jgi:hypothetical protein